MKPTTKSRAMPPIIRDLRYWMCAALLCAGGFAVTWHYAHIDGPAPVASAGVESAQLADVQAHASGRRADAGFVELGKQLDGLAKTMKPALPATAIRKSRLPEWMRFRYEHPTVALSTETAIRWALGNPSPIRELVTDCATKERIPFASVNMSAEIEIRERDATVRGWGCDPNADASSEERICECILEHLPDEIHVVVPPDVAKKDLVSYEGMLSIQL